MKKIIFTVFILIFMWTACSKKNNETTGGDYDPTINGQVYSTTVINGQTWTTENYNNANNDGITYKFGTDTPAHGLLYTIAAAEAIT